MSQAITRVNNRTAVSNESLVEAVVIMYLVAILAMGFFWPGNESLINGLQSIATSPGILISDFMAIAGPGAALFNAGLVGLAGVAMLRVTRTAISGPTIAALFTLVGFALFGKTLFNILPIIGGVYLYALCRREPLKVYILPALFGTALGPLVSQLTFGSGLSPSVAAMGGAAVGFCLPAIAGHLLHNHRGHNLYNIGFTAGIVGTVALALMKSMSLSVSPAMHWSTEYSSLLGPVFFLYFLTMVIVGLLMGGTAAGLREIMKLPGALVTDFMTIAGFSSTLINMGLIGITGLGYIHFVGGPVNGPTLGGVLTMVGFAAFGKHLGNALPIMAGVWLGCLVQVPRAGDPGALLAALFGTTLAPVAGSFGPVAGVAAGFVHLATVMHVGVMHGGLNLYNNGLSGGLVATVFVAVGKSFLKRG